MKLVRKEKAEEAVVVAGEAVIVADTAAGAADVAVAADVAATEADAAAIAVVTADATVRIFLGSLSFKFCEQKIRAHRMGAEEYVCPEWAALRGSMSGLILIGLSSLG